MKNFFAVLSLLVVFFAPFVAQAQKQPLKPIQVFGGVEQSISWTPQNAQQKSWNPNGNPATHTFSATVQIPHFQLSLGDMWQKSTFESEARQYLSTSCWIMQNGVKHCEQDYRDTVVTRTMKSGFFNASAMYLVPLWSQKGIFVTGGVGLRLNGFRNPQIQVNESQNGEFDVQLRKDVVYQPNFLAMVQIRKNFTASKGEWNVFSELSFESQSGYNEFGFAPSFFARSTYNATKWLYVGGQVTFRAYGTEYAQSGLGGIVGFFIHKNLTVNVGFNANTIARQISAPKGEKTHNATLGLRYGF